MPKQKDVKRKLSRRTFLKGAGAVAAGTVVTATGGLETDTATVSSMTSAQAKTEGPNILLIVTDQERFSSISLAV